MLVVRRYIYWTGLSVLSGILSGGAAALFLALLALATDSREAHRQLIWFLPVAGFIIGWIYYRFGQDIAGGNNLIMEEIHDPKKIVPMRMAPFVLVGTLVTHFFGGSAGREGTAVQMGASLSDQLSRVFKVEPEERKILLVAGAGAGFGAAIGAPLAGIIFGMEVIYIGRLRFFALFECTVASFVAFYTVRFLGVAHTVYPQFEIPDLTIKTLIYIGIAGVIFGLVARVFSLLIHFLERLEHRFISYSPLRPFAAGLVLLALYRLEASYRYTGLGIPIIQQALQTPATFRDPLLKIFFTVITIASGFKGGEFIPLVFIGATLGSALSILLPVSFKLLAAMGFVAVFAGASNTPIACSLMALELFGYQIFPYALAACFASYCFSGKKGIYRGQKSFKD